MNVVEVGYVKAFPFVEAGGDSTFPDVRRCAAEGVRTVEDMSIYVDVIRSNE